MIKSARISLFLLASTVAAGIAHAQDIANSTSTFGDMSISLKSSLQSMQANEVVYGAGGRRGSLLVWKSIAAPVVTGSMHINLESRFWLKASASVGLGGNSHMTDYDWLSPYNRGYSRNGWSDRSIHPDTRLNHYYNIELMAGRSIYETDDLSINLGAGIKLTDVRWTTRGGSYIYSTAGRRDDVGTFSPNLKGVSYRQFWPVPQVSLDVTKKMDAWTLSGGINAGLTFAASDHDQHWASDLRFRDHFRTALALGAQAEAAYEFSPGRYVTIGGAFEKIARAKGSTVERDLLAGTKARFKRSAGADFQSMSLSIGIRGTF